MSFKSESKSEVQFDAEVGLQRCQHVLNEVKSALNYSDLLEAGLTRSLGCSRHQWVQRIRDTYGDPGLDEKFAARKLVEEYIDKEGAGSVVSKTRIFVVANPI
ncbi:hypothetical protein [Microbulbifer variabilis]|uniref:hypothetical protein n=1 Tax=Microbulbifer variabilis TaxID=266805 RepID=UPI001CFE177C|nr:hypothetical protein [Microbulbifer variabilis]